MKVSSLTGQHNYFEDFTVGEVLKHARGKTVEPLEQVWITNVTMNTAEGHFNEHLMKSSPWGKRLGFGGVTISMCIGLAAQDTAENALMELNASEPALRDWQPLMAAKGHFLGKCGQPAEAEAILTRFADLSKTRYVTSYGVALVHAGLGHDEETL